eukprot:gene51564-27413_t
MSRTLRPGGAARPGPGPDDCAAVIYGNDGSRVVRVTGGAAGGTRAAWARAEALCSLLKDSAENSWEAGRMGKLALQGLPAAQLAPLCRALPHMGQLRWLNLGGSRGVLPTAASAERLAAALRQLTKRGATTPCLPRLARLWLQGCGVGAAAVRALAQHLAAARGRGWTVVIDDADARLRDEMAAARLCYDAERDAEGGFDFW